MSDSRKSRFARAAALIAVGVPLAGILLYALIINVLASLPPSEEPLTLRPLSEQADVRLLPAEGIDGRLDLNTATRDQLMELPGVGEKTADAILAMREELGGFLLPEDLLLIRGIGEKKLAALRDWICVLPITE